jgi:hypothetical protein
MDALIAIAPLAAFVAVWWFTFHRASGGRIWSPLWMAFSATAASMLFVVAGAIGYTLSRRDRFVAETAWSDGVIWWQVLVGLALVPLALILWRVGLRSLGPDPRAGLRH